MLYLFVEDFYVVSRDECRIANTPVLLLNSVITHNDPSQSELKPLFSEHQFCNITFSAESQAAIVRLRQADDERFQLIDQLRDSKEETKSIQG